MVPSPIPVELHNEPPGYQNECNQDQHIDFDPINSVFFRKLRAIPWIP